jgi:O-antigen/teichoic acid export membrane protein
LELLKMRMPSFLQGKSALAGVSHGFLANLLIAGASLLTGIVTARALGPSGRGELAALTTLPTFLPYLLTLGVPNSLVFHLRHEPEHSGEIMGAGLLVGVVAGLFSIAVAIACTPFVLRELPVSLIPTACVAAVFTFFNVFILFLIASLQSAQEFSAYNAIRYAHPLIVLTITSGLALNGLLTPVLGAVIVLAAGLPGLVWSLVWVVRHFRPQLTNLRGSLNRLASYSIRSYSGDLTLAIATQIDRVIVVGIFSPRLMGIYTVAASLARLVGMFSNAVVPVLFPKAIGRPIAEVVEITSQAARITAVLVGITSVFLLVAGPTLMQQFYGAGFEGADAAFRMLVLEAAVSSIVQILAQAFMALGRPGLVTLQYGSGAIATVVLLLLLAPRYALEGTAAALLIATLIRLAVTYASFPLAMRTGAPKIWGNYERTYSTLKSALRSKGP